MSELNKTYFLKKAIVNHIKKYNSDKPVTLCILLDIVKEAELEYIDAEVNFREIVKHSREVKND